MRRAIAAVVSGLALLAGVGCQNFSYVQRDAQGGVIEVKASDREAALAKLQQEEGAIEVVMEQPKSKTSGGLFDPNKPVGPSERMAATSSGFGSLMASRDEDKVQIQYRKKGTTPPGLPPADNRGGVTPVGGIQTKSQYDRTPGTGSGVVPAGGKTGGTLPTPDMTGLNLGGK